MIWISIFRQGPEGQIKNSKKVNAISQNPRGLSERKGLEENLFKEMIEAGKNINLNEADCQ